MRGYYKTVLILFLWAGVGGIETVAMEFAIESSLGYSDNVTQSQEEKGSVFNRYQIGLYHELLKENARIETRFGIEGDYTLYTEAEDNYGGLAQLFFLFPFDSGRLNPGVLIEGAIYRDEEVEEDSKDEVSLTGFLTWMAHPRFAIELYQTVGWASYNGDEDATNETFSPSNVSNKGNGGRHRQKSAGSDPYQEGFYITEIQGIFYFSPSMTLKAFIDYETTDASEDTENNVKYGGGSSLEWTFDFPVTLYASIYYSQNDFPDAPDGRFDTGINASSGVTWNIDDIEFFLDVGWNETDSTIESEAYRQRTVQCGASYLF